jgi:hypothetical protein
MNAAIYSIVDAVLIKPLAFHAPEQLVRLTAGPREARHHGHRARAGRARRLPLADDLFESVAGIYSINFNLTAVDEPERIEGQLVSGNYFDVLGVTASVGQVFHQSDEIPGNAELVVISDGLWRRRFGADPNVVGRRIRLDNDFYTIVGVLPASFHHPGRNLQEEPDIYGLFDQPEYMPAKISIYQRPLEQDFPDPAELEEQIRITVLHELAHYFGFEEDRISDLGYE